MVNTKFLPFFVMDCLEEFSPTYTLTIMYIGEMLGFFSLYFTSVAKKQKPINL